MIFSSQQQPIPNKHTRKFIFNTPESLFLTFGCRNLRDSQHPVSVRPCCYKKIRSDRLLIFGFT
jgi:hypothetical protein